MSQGKKKVKLSEMDLKSKVSENTTVKPCTLRMRFLMEHVPSVKMYLKFKLDSLFQQMILWRIFSSVHGFCTAISCSDLKKFPFIYNENYPVQA